jgi:hypothetical protein
MGINCARIYDRIDEDLTALDRTGGPLWMCAAVAYAAGKPLAGEYTLSGADAEGLFPAILGHEGADIVKVDLTRRFRY